MNTTDLELEIDRCEKIMSRIEKEGFPEFIDIGKSCYGSYPDSSGWYLEEITEFKKNLFGVKSVTSYVLRYGGYDTDGRKVKVTSDIIKSFMDRYNSLKETLGCEKPSEKRM